MMALSFERTTHTAARHPGIIYPFANCTHDIAPFTSGEYREKRCAIFGLSKNVLQTKYYK